MKDRYVIDTNVLIAASAAMATRSGKPLLPHHREVTPQDAAQLEKVLDWLIAFEQSESRLVLDNAGQINVEYHHKLDFYDYGIQVVMLKLSREQIDRVNVEYDADGNGIVPQPLDETVHDLADRKMVAAAIAALQLPGSSAVAFAGDTDWYDWETALLQTGLTLEPIIETWSRAKYAEKTSRQAKRRHQQTPQGSKS
ncbi:MAG: hypothetical protein Q7U82_00350 [Gammaproteobacteria bacterium]|nr:hypothetical protein [Gammaproteobacteria bacterium]